MQNFLSLWLNAGAQITLGGRVQRPRQNASDAYVMPSDAYVRIRVFFSVWSVQTQNEPGFEGSLFLA